MYLSSYATGCGGAGPVATAYRTSSADIRLCAMLYVPFRANFDSVRVFVCMTFPGNYNTCENCIL